MTKALTVLAFLLVGISAAHAAPIKAKYCVAVAATDSAQEKQLTGMVARFAAAHALKKLSNQAPNTDAYRSADETVQVAITTKLGDMGTVLFLFDVNQPIGPSRGQLAAYVKKNVEPAFKVTRCVDIKGFKTPTIG